MKRGRWKSGELLLFGVDVIMLVLILVNLTWILLDGLYSSHYVRDAIGSVLPLVVQWYDPIHANFSFYDLFFVAVFVTELLIRWIVAAIRGTYHRWWFYPFIHWYDTLGCIPVGSFRFLRIFRIVSMVFRLQRNQVIDFTRTYLFRQGNKYYRILVEEISDRVVLNVLDGVRKEVRGGSPLVEQVVRNSIEPRKSDLARWLSDRIQVVVGEHYAVYRPDLRQYVDVRIESAVKENREVASLKSIPILGGTIHQTLERAIADIVFQVLDGMIRDLASPQSKVLIEETTGAALDVALFQESDLQLEQTIRTMTTEILDQIAERVKVQEWKVEEEREKAVRARAKRWAKIRRNKRQAE
jgi:hypothetical protein